MWRKAQGKMIIGMQGARGTASAISGSSESGRAGRRRRGCSTSCRSARSVRTAVVRGRERSARACSTGPTTGLLVVVGPCSVHDPKAALEYARRLSATARALQRRPADRDARLLREAADDDGLEGPDQRPASGRLGRRQRRPADRPQTPPSRCSTSACRSAASSSTRSRRSTSPTRSPGGRSARARRRARSTASWLGPLDADRLQEPHRRQHPGRGRRGAGGGGLRTPSRESTTPACRRSCTRPATPTAT